MKNFGILFQNVLNSPVWNKTFKAINYLSNQSLVTFKQVSADYFESFNEIPYVGALPLENEILLGNDIASRLGIRTGDIVKISSPLDKKFILGFPPTLEVKVSGIFSSKILNYDNKYIFISKTIGKTLFSNVIENQFLDIKLHHSSKSYSFSGVF